MRTLEPTEFTAVPTEGRVFTQQRRVRANDVDPQRRLRLDGMARYLQDIAFDDLNDAGFGEKHAYWVLRRCVVRVLRPAQFDEDVRLHSWCSGYASRWCTKRVQIEGDDGALIETEGFWVNVSAETGMPTPLSQDFFSMFHLPAADRELRWRRMLTPPRAPEGEHLRGTPFPLRVTDFDWFSHVNNAAYWFAVEEHLDAEHRGLLDGPHEAVLEYNTPITRGEQVEVMTTTDADAVHLWFLVAGRVRAAARIRPLGPDAL
ncbi:acyl-ACP thioesterase domain-containing protein [Rhodococcus sp. X156]|uniref:acyl-[acyl-carrier-protein] thioesterase n=1 Tax=Rhodococcus sp. X156 TaxID=2499145 RepID=UPI000FD95D20|nr:acyl-ACP thioesterase domain-containing protein [Rhodococcus sp. X156]